MASNDDTKDEYLSLDSGYFRVETPSIRQIQGTRLKTVADLLIERESYKTENKQLRNNIVTLNRKVLAYERNFGKEKTLLECTKRVELKKRNISIQQAKVKFEKMRKRNTALIWTIKENENTINALETIEMELQTKHGAFKDKKKRKSKSRETEDNEKELRDLKQRLQDLETELEEKDKMISNNISKESKVNKKLEDMTGILGQIANSIEEGKKKEAIMVHRLDNVEQNVNHILVAVQGAKIEGTNANNRKQQADMYRSTERVTKLPPLTKDRSNRPEKPP